MSKICPTPFPCCSLEIIPTTLGTYPISVPLPIYGFTVLNGNGGVAPFTFSIDVAGDNALSDLGLGLNPNGTFSGAPVFTGTASFIVSVVDASGKCTGQADYTITIVA